MSASARLERAAVNRKCSSQAALGPYPRSAWIHPHTPEDDLDKACFKIWRRSVWAKRGIWPHFVENAHRFVDDPLLNNIRNNCATHNSNNQQDEAGMVMGQHEIDKVSLMVQQEIVQTLQQGHDTVTPFQTNTGDGCSLGDKPDHPEEIISREEAKRREIEKFLKDTLISNQGDNKDIHQELSLEEFPPLPCATSPWPAKKGQIRSNVSCEIPASNYRRSAFDDLSASKPQRNQRQPRHQRFKSVVDTEASVMEEIQGTQASKAHNEPYSQLSHSCQTGAFTEAANVSTAEAAVDGGQMSKKQGRFILPVFGAFHIAEKLMIENLPITAQGHDDGNGILGGDGLQGKSADGTRVARDPAGTDTTSMRKTAGPPQKAWSHLFQEETTVQGRKAQSSPNHRVGMPIGHMAGVQAQPCQKDKAEWGKSTRYIPQKSPLLEHHGPAPAAGMLASSFPAPCPSLHPPPGFTHAQITPESVALACIWLSCGVLQPGCLGVPSLPAMHTLHPFHPFRSDNFPDNVNPQGASRQCFMHSPNGFGAAEASRPPL